jgi:hypothetical protein
MRRCFVLLFLLAQGCISSRYDAIAPTIEAAKHSEIVVITSGERVP